MLSDVELERMFVSWKLPEAGRQLVRQIRSESPVRDVKRRMDNVRTRFISQKMGRALYAESRTVELPGIMIREHDKTTIEMWPQPCTIDLVTKATGGGATRLQHTPDLFAITERGFEIDEWREEARLRRLATERPHHFFKDDHGCWHYIPVEEHFAALGFTYRLRSADEHPRVFLANLEFLADYCLESAPPVPQDECDRLRKLMQQSHRISHLSLVYEHHFKADHIFQLLLQGDAVYVDLYAQRLDLTDELYIYENEVISRADSLLRNGCRIELPSSALIVRPGTTFVYQEQEYIVVLTGTTEAMCRATRIEDAETTPIRLDLIKALFDRKSICPTGSNVVENRYSLNDVICNQKNLQRALVVLEAVKNGSAAGVSERSIQRWAANLSGVTDIQERIKKAMPGRGGNRTPRIPAAVIEVAEAIVKAEHNQPHNPSEASTYGKIKDACEAKGLIAMCQSSFYEWIKKKESKRARQGDRAEYQEASIPLTIDYEQPVHGVLPHQVVYIDHTVVNQFLRGIRLPDLGKPTLTIATDGACVRTRAFYLSYRPAGSVAVLMVLRDYVRRWGRLPRMIVVDNAKEFHSRALEEFCSLFNISIRWRKRSKPRNSTLVERALGVSEQELIANLKGNTVCLKDPRMVSSSVNPANFITWTLPALHGSLDHFFFRVLAERIHPRIGMRPDEHEGMLVAELGAREHLFVRFDPVFMLMTSLHSVQPTRKIDRQRGVFVDGMYYWNDRLRSAKKQERCEVRVEQWCASVVYLCFRDDWIVAQARDGRRLEGRFRYEYEMQRREEARRRRTAAQTDRVSTKNVRKKAILYEPGHWDERLREQQMEAHYLYSRLGMCEALPDGRNARASSFELPPTSEQMQPTKLCLPMPGSQDSADCNALRPHGSDGEESQLILEGFDIEKRSLTAREPKEAPNYF